LNINERFVDEWSVGFMEKLPIISWKSSLLFHGENYKNYTIFSIYSKKLQVIYTIGKN
jgi:hypothetical protein